MLKDIILGGVPGISYVDKFKEVEGPHTWAPWASWAPEDKEPINELSINTESHVPQQTQSDQTRVNQVPFIEPEISKDVPYSTFQEDESELVSYSDDPTYRSIDTEALSDYKTSPFFGSFGTKGAVAEGLWNAYRARTNKRPIREEMVFNPKFEEASDFASDVGMGLMYGAADIAGGEIGGRLISRLANYKKLSNADKLKEAIKKGKAYIDEAADPRNLDRARKLDKRGTVKDVIRQEPLIRHLKTRSDMVSDNPLNTSVRKLEGGVRGRATYWPEKETALSSKLPLKAYEKVIAHEGKHFRTAGKMFISKPLKKQIKKGMFSRDDVYKVAVEKNKSFWNYPQYGEDLMREHHYLSTPTEFDAFVGTNLKQELVDLGYINSVHDKVSSEVLKKAIESKKSSVLKRYNPFIKDYKEFRKALNMSTYGILPVAVGGKAIKQNKQTGDYTE